MGTNVITADRKPAVEKEKRVLHLELDEIREISDLMYKKLELKMRAMQALEASVDKKKSALEQLILRAEELETRVRAGEGALSAADGKIATLNQFVERAELLRAPDGGMNRRQEIVALSRKGLPSREIAEVIDMPLGEVELILELDLRTV
jgi:DNA-directed RNA polymerase specialized sigma24 family protein